MNILVLIAARGGSEGVKGKNIRRLAGKPLIAHSILCAKAWPRATRVVVSTDSADIASVARDYGADVPFMRPAALATSTADKFQVIRHALVESERIFGEQFDLVVDLDATSPLRTIRDLDACLDLFERERPQTIFSVVKAHKNPYFNMVERGADGRVRLSKPLPANIHRRQDAPPAYAMNASIYLYDRQFLLDPKNVSPFSDHTLVHVMDDVAGFDVDREVDFQFLDFLVERGFVSLTPEGMS